jgi:putative transposase
MPDHLHGILFINKPNKVSWEPNKFGAQRNNLASIIRGYKSSVKTYATLNDIEFLWQPRFYDRVIRDEKEYFAVAKYIVTILKIGFGTKINLKIYLTCKDAIPFKILIQHL